MSISYEKTVWELDSRWLRVVAVDDLGQPLGRVHFEPNPDFDLPKPGNYVALSHRRPSLGSIRQPVFNWLPIRIVLWSALLGLFTEFAPHSDADEAYAPIARAVASPTFSSYEKAKEGCDDQRVMLRTEMAYQVLLGVHPRSSALES